MAARPAGQPRVLPRSVPELGSPGDVSADLIQAEYEVRRQFGAPLTLEDYNRRFPHQAEELARLITPSGRPQSRHSSVAAPFRSSPPVQKSRETPGNSPQQFGRYRIIKRLGQGGMGSVYLAQDTQLERRGGPEGPRLRAHEGPEARRRFLDEARTAATLDHPYLCPVYDAGEIDGQPYLTMAYIEGQSLAALIGDEGWPQRQVAALVGKLALAMQEAHTQKVVHRDLKPANVMIKTTGQRREPVIVDFGLARRDNPEEQRLTRSGQVMGTLGYMAPEQIRGDLKEIGPACDIYALGVILYELLTGRLPFSGSGLAVAGQILTEDAAAPFDAPERPRPRPRGDLPEGDGQDERGPLRLDGRPGRGPDGISSITVKKCDGNDLRRFGRVAVVDLTNVAQAGWEQLSGRPVPWPAGREQAVAAFRPGFRTGWFSSASALNGAGECGRRSSRLACLASPCSSSCALRPSTRATSTIRRKVPLTPPKSPAIRPRPRGLNTSRKS